MGTFTLKVMTSATAIRTSAAPARSPAVDCRPRISNTQRTRADRSAAGISTLIGPPRLAIIKRPTSRNVPGVIAAIERLRLNHVPQKTPVTRENSSSVTNCTALITTHLLRMTQQQEADADLQQPLTAAPACSPRAGFLTGFTQLDRIAVRVLDLNLTSARTGFHLVAEADPGALESGDTAGEVRDAQHDAVPAAGLLPLTVRHRPRAGRSGPTQQDL